MLTDPFLLISLLLHYILSMTFAYFRMCCRQASEISAILEWRVDLKLTAVCTIVQPLPSHLTQGFGFADPLAPELHVFNKCSLIEHES
jgi:hypothetical protein